MAESARLAAAEERLSRITTAISNAESAITDKESDLHQRAALVETNMVAQVKKAVSDQRGEVRHAVRGLLIKLAEEEEHRAAMEGTLELSAKEAECTWRAELLKLYRETSARVQRLSAAQASRYQRLEACMSATADQGPEAAAQQDLLVRLAAETRQQVQREMASCPNA